MFIIEAMYISGSETQCVYLGQEAFLASPYIHLLLNHVTMPRSPKQIRLIHNTGQSIMFYIYDRIISVHNCLSQTCWLQFSQYREWVDYFLLIARFINHSCGKYKRFRTIHGLFIYLLIHLLTRCCKYGWKTVSLAHLYSKVNSPLSYNREYTTFIQQRIYHVHSAKRIYHLHTAKRIHHFHTAN